MDTATRCASRRLLSGAILLTLILVIVALVAVLQQPATLSEDRTVQSKYSQPGAAESQETEANGILSAGQRPLCSPAVFRQHYRAKGYFPGAGVWTPTGQYNPDICKFSNPATMETTLAKCFVGQNITSIVFFGASHGKRFMTPLQGMIEHAFPKCERVKSENQVDRLPQVSYYTAGRPDIVGRLLARKRHCAGCTSQKTICNASSGAAGVSLEYIGMDDLLDSTLRLQMKARPLSIETFQEFIIHKYLAPNPPDLIIISPAANHAKFKSLPKKFAMDVTYLKNLIRIYMPKTRTFWLTGTSEHNNIKATEAINRLNQVMFQVNKNDFLDPNSGVLGFLDLVAMSQTCPDEWWDKSGIFLSDLWYKEIMMYILSYLCV